MQQSQPLARSLGIRLSFMMFLQFAIWGAWLPILWPFLRNYHQFEPAEIGDMFAVGAAGAIVGPFVAGQIADRYFSTERFLGISHIVGGILVWQLASLESYWGFLWFSLAYSFIYAPTLALTNSLSFHHLPDRDRDFGKIRVWGTVGWIAAGIGIGQWLLYQHSPADLTGAALDQARYAGMADAFRLSAILGIGMGLYCFFLPRTPPSKGQQAYATWEAKGEVQSNARLMALFLFAIVVSCIHQFYFVHTAGFLGTYQSETASTLNKVFGVGGGGLMTLGQMSEIAVLALIPLVAVKWSRKTLLAIGLAAYALRMILFAHVEDLHASLGVDQIPILMLGVAMHGLCFGCFIFVAFMIVDEETTPDVRASAQNLFNLVIVGFGIIVGSKIATGVAEWATDSTTNELNFKTLFSVPMWASILTLIAFLFLYPGGKRKSIGGTREVVEPVGGAADGD